MIFVDYNQAYDSIIQEELWMTLAYLGIPINLTTLIQICNADTFSGIQFKNILSHTFIILLKMDYAKGMLCYQYYSTSH